MKRSAPPGCLASTSVAPSPTMTRELIPNRSCRLRSHDDHEGRFQAIPLASTHAASVLTLMCRTADALPPLRDVNSSASKPA
jgi:hypothetical protein